MDVYPVATGQFPPGDMPLPAGASFQPEHGPMAVVPAAWIVGITPMKITASAYAGPGTKEIRQPPPVPPGRFRQNPAIMSA